MVSKSNIEDISNYLEANKERMAEVVVSLDKPLRNNSALTNIGRSLYEHLVSRPQTLSHRASEFLSRFTF